MPTVEEDERAALAGGPAASERQPAGRGRAPLSGREEEYLDAEREVDALRLAEQRHNEVMNAQRKTYAKLLDLEKRIMALERRPAPASAAAGGSGPRDDGGLDLDAVAGDRDLDGAKGDPMVKFDPREKYWTGQSFQNYKFSETTPDYLDAMAKSLAAAAYMAAKDPDENKRKSAKWKALDASRARGWAKRLRAGWAGAPPQTSRSAAQGQGAGAAPAADAGDGVMF